MLLEMPQIIAKLGLKMAERPDSTNLCAQKQQSRIRVRRGCWCGCQDNMTPACPSKRRHRLRPKQPNTRSSRWPPRNSPTIKKSGVF